MKDILYIFGNVLLTILVIILLIWGFVFVERVMMMKPNIEFGNYVLYYQKDDSMETDFNKDDFVILEKTNDCVEGDIVLYHTGKNNYDFGKIVSKEENSVTTKCNKCTDSNKVKNGQLYAKAVAKVYTVGPIIMFLGSGKFLLFLGGIGLVLILISSLIPQKKNIKLKIENV